MAVNGKSKKIDYDGWSKPELIKEIQKLNKRKKYGLIWDEERTKEIFEQEAQKKLPILKDVTKNGIEDKSKPNNILIEGDNYHVLSVLNYTHRGKIDMIYIDPPYNTGKEFIYNDKLVDVEDSYKHSKWISFMNKRLQLAKRLLSKKGLIFISIDDNEIAQLKLLCDEIFYNDNFISQLPVVTNLKGNNDEFGFAGTHEYVLVYAKNKSTASINQFLIDDEEIEMWNKDEYGYYKKGANLKSTGVNAPREKRPNLFFPLYVTKENTISIKRKSNRDVEIFPITDGKEMSWRWSKSKIENEAYNIIVTRNKDNIAIYKKQRPLLGDLPSKKPKSLFYKPEYSSGNGTEQLRAIFGSKIFPNPKPMNLIKDLIMLGSHTDSMICDFMAGSGTTGQAVLELNKEDGGNRKFILCTNNENKICTDVCYPRLKKVIKGYKNTKNEKIEGLQGNLKYFKTSFVDSEPTDQNKKVMVEQSTEMLCLKEDCFELVKEGQQFKIFKNNDECYLGIIYYFDGIEPFKKEVKKLDKKINTYVFSLTDEIDEDEFEDIRSLVTLKPIPSAILNVYRSVFAYVQTEKLPRKTR